MTSFEERFYYENRSVSTEVVNIAIGYKL